MNEYKKSILNVQDFDYTYEEVVYFLRRYLGTLNVMIDYGNVALMNERLKDNVEFLNNLLMLECLADGINNICDMLDKFA